MESPKRLTENCPPATPLNQVSPERVNHNKNNGIYHNLLLATRVQKASKHSRDSSVNDKIAQFNSLAHQGKQLERKTNDAALKRAMVGREEAESEMRRYRDEARILRRQVEEGKERERKVGERLESVMENYGRAKETHSHTQALWEKKFEELEKKASRDTLRMVQGGLEQEKVRSVKREQEAFAAKKQLAEVQEKLTRLQEKIKLVEQERDAFKTIAKNEEIARIAAEGRIPLPQSTKDEFSSPNKDRKSIDPVTVSSSSGAGQEELDDLRLKLEWEIQRANRALDQVEFLEMESTLHHLKAFFKSVPEESSSKPAENMSSEENMDIKPSSQNSSQQQREVTPSHDPPSTAQVSDANTSLLSIFDEAASPKSSRSLQSPINLPEDDATSENLNASTSTTIHYPQSENDHHHHHREQTFHTVSTTTRIPLADPSEDQAHDTTPKTPTSSALPNNTNDPALASTVSREEALAMIRERRGRARSLANGTMTPRKQMVEGGNRRDVSAPAGGATPARGRSQIRF
ncbi:hypothetical protein DID88_008116 [Monilinia fructigena]|uniref:Uncharacterized protein n=1 Tax=Monilinia fructigena TaxID=38457 RepID=A0A395J4T6_9HELO|nr:hypothetical protein DID88_008116 [Monilinia fructigena]